MENKKLPVGIENFEKIRREDFYYIDKTGLIRDLLRDWGEVNLFTRPRRFGKTLNMSMLKCFFEIGTDASLFDGLAIAREKDLCEEYLGQYPVISLTLKGVDGLNFEAAYNALRSALRGEVARLRFLLESAAVNEADKQPLERFLHEQDTREDVLDSLKMLCALLYQHHGQKVILLIDEYDVPLDKAFLHGYYPEMASLLRGLLGNALKTNDFLQFAVLTGCLRVSKESIFTGLNNLKALSILDARFCEYFGFTDGEVRRMLADYGLSSHYAETKDWYDGYRFGNAEMYCPWDVINHVDRLRAEPNAHPQDYWINTSGNDMVRRFVDKADKSTQKEIERLIVGEAIEKRLRLELTYGELEESIENLWSVLFTTGYLTQAGEVETERIQAGDSQPRSTGSVRFADSGMVQKSGCGGREAHAGAARGVCARGRGGRAPGTERGHGQDDQHSGRESAGRAEGKFLSRAAVGATAGGAGVVDPIERGIGRRVLRHSGGAGRPGRGVGDRGEVRFQPGGVGGGERAGA